MQKFTVQAELVDKDGALVIAPDGDPVRIYQSAIPASAPHVAVKHAMGKMSSKFDKVMKRFYSATPRMGVGDKLTISCWRDE